jgi:hypothetical protein
MHSDSVEQAEAEQSLLTDPEYYSAVRDWVLTAHHAIKPVFLKRQVLCAITIVLAFSSCWRSEQSSMGKGDLGEILSSLIFFILPSVRDGRAAHGPCAFGR